MARVVVFKGLYLAELVFQHPAQRHYHDVDVLVPPDTWEQAEAIATQVGWTITWRCRDSLYRWSHEEAILTQGTAEIEAHRFVIDGNSRNDPWQRRITEAAWAGSSEVPWEDTTMRILSPVDSLLMGLVLAGALGVSLDDVPEPPSACSVRSGGSQARSPISRGCFGCSVRWVVVRRPDPCRLRSRGLFDALRTTPYPVRLYEGRALDGGGHVHKVAAGWSAWRSGASVAPSAGWQPRSAHNRRRRSGSGASARHLPTRA